VALALAEVHERLAADHSGSLSSVYPVLAAADPDLFGLSVVSVTGQVARTGDADVVFPIMSVSKPFVFALVCAAVGVDAVRRRVGVNATGLAFNSATAVERDPQGRTNPMVRPSRSTPARAACRSRPWTSR